MDMTEKEILAYELQQVHAEAVRLDVIKRRNIRWELEAEDARTAALLGATA